MALDARSVALGITVPLVTAILTKTIVLKKWKMKVDYDDLIGIGTAMVTGIALAAIVMPPEYVPPQTVEISQR